MAAAALWRRVVPVRFWTPRPIFRSFSVLQIPKPYKFNIGVWESLANPRDLGSREPQFESVNTDHLELVSPIVCGY